MLNLSRTTIINSTTSPLVVEYHREAQVPLTLTLAANEVLTGESMVWTGCQSRGFKFTLANVDITVTDMWHVEVKLLMTGTLEFNISNTDGKLIKRFEENAV